MKNKSAAQHILESKDISLFAKQEFLEECISSYKTPKEIVELLDRLDFNRKLAVKLSDGNLDIIEFVLDIIEQ